MESVKEYLYKIFISQGWNKLNVPSLFLFFISFIYILILFLFFFNFKYFIYLTLTLFFISTFFVILYTQRMYFFNLQILFTLFILLFIIFFFFSFFLYSLSTSLNHLNVKYFIYYSLPKYIFGYLIFFIIYIQIIKKKRIVIYLFIVLLYFILMLLYSKSPLYIILIYLVNSFIPLFVFTYILEKKVIQFLGKELINKVDLILLVTNISYIIIFILGYIFFLYPKVWEYLSIDLIYNCRGFEVINGFPKPWWFNFNNENIFIRFVGLFKDPIIMGYVSVFIFFINLKYKNYPMSLLALIGTLLSISKGAITLLISVLILVKYKSLLKLINKNFLYFTLSSVTITTIILSLSLILKTSLNIHMLGLLLPFLNISKYNIFQILIGHGIGSGGNLALAYGYIDRNIWLVTGSESGIGTIFYQLGIIGIILYFYLMYRIYKNLGDNLAKGLVFFYTVNSFLQENLINLSYIIIFILAILLIEINNIKTNNCLCLARGKNVHSK